MRLHPLTPIEQAAVWFLTTLVAIAIIGLTLTLIGLIS